VSGPLTYFFWAVITTAVYFGGWALPISMPEGISGTQQHIFLAVGEVLWTLTKVVLLTVLAKSLSYLIPFLRVDKATDLSWVVLGPISIFTLLLTIVRTSTWGAQ